MRPDADGAVAILEEYERALRRLFNVLTVDDVPEVGTNLAYAPWGACSPEDVYGLAGRIIIAGRTGRLAVGGEAARGGPGHTGKIALALTEAAAGPWWVMNHRFSEAFLRRARTAGLVLVEFDRKTEPASAISTMEWGTREAIRSVGTIPDGTFDRGAWGKEPMIRLFARTFDALLLVLLKLQTGMPSPPNTL